MPRVRGRLIADPNRFPVAAMRKANIDALVYWFGTQTDLIKHIPSSGLQQPHISLIVNSRQRLSENEARSIERDLEIPAFWLDKYPLKEIHEIWMDLMNQPESVRNLVNSVLQFVDSHRPANERAVASGQ